MSILEHKFYCQFGKNSNKQRFLLPAIPRRVPFHQPTPVLCEKKTNVYYYRETKSLKCSLETKRGTCSYKIYITSEKGHFLLVRERERRKKVYHFSRSLFCSFILMPTAKNSRLILPLAMEEWGYNLESRIQFGAFL